MKKKLNFFNLNLILKMIGILVFVLDVTPTLTGSLCVAYYWM